MAIEPLWTEHKTWGRTALTVTEPTVEPPVEPAPTKRTVKRAPRRK